MFVNQVYETVWTNYIPDPECLRLEPGDIAQREFCSEVRSGRAFNVSRVAVAIIAVLGSLITIWWTGSEPFRGTLLNNVLAALVHVVLLFLGGAVVQGVSLGYVFYGPPPAGPGYGGFVFLMPLWLTIQLIPFWLLFYGIACCFWPGSNLVCGITRAGR
jgi:hypothetical protein